MIDRRSALAGLATGAVLTGAASPALASPVEGNETVDTLTMASAAFRVEVDRHTGGILSIVHPSDPAAMSWVGAPPNALWQPRGSLWGLGFADLGGVRMHRVRWGEPASIERHGPADLTILYRLDDLDLTVRRTLSGDTLNERYTFTNTGREPLALRKSRGPAALAIYTPCNDHYTTPADVLEHRAHAHIWAGGAASWIAMLRMGGRAPHLGLVLTEGALDGYSIEDRDLVTLSNTRGTILLHPVIDTLAPGESAAIGWTLFWHDGWDRFRSEAMKHSAQMVAIESSAWTTVPGERSTLRFSGQLGPSPSLAVNGRSVALTRAGAIWTADLPAGEPGERTAELTYRDGLKTEAKLNGVPGLRALVEERVRFITRRQQWLRDGDPWDGAYLLFDNDADAPVRWERSNDRGPGQERLAMSVLVARWLGRDGATDPAMKASLDKCYTFVMRELQRADGFVLPSPGLTIKRLYNWPWAVQLHLAMSRLEKGGDALDRAVTTVDSFYREGGADAYVLGLPIADMLRELEAAGMQAGHDRLLSLFAGHGRRIIERGTRYPPHEVNFEQSIVAPAANILLELHAATGERKWLDAARPHVAMLDLFEGKQPDHRLHGISIRHWDGYWFGKARMWGDTFTHYWSSLNALAWWRMGQATGDTDWTERARVTLRNNLSLFNADGSASCAFVYPATVNGQPGRFADAYANDQDWALVHALDIGEV